MANSNTEHSKKLRAKTAAEHNRKMSASGKVRPITLRLESSVADEFDAVLAELGATRPAGIKALCEFYRKYS